MKTKNMQVIQLVDKFNYGGAESVALSYWHTLNNLVEECYLIGLDVGRKSENDTIIVESNYYHYFFNLFKKIWTYDEKTLIVSHTVRSFFIAILLRILFPFKCRFIFVQHLNYPPQKVAFFSFFSFLFHRYIQITPTTEKLMSKYIPDEKRFYFNNYICSSMTTFHETDIEKILEQANSREIIIFCSAIRKGGKNPSHMIELAKILPTDKYFFLIIGDGSGDEFDQFKMDLEDFRGDNLRWLGYRKDAISFMHYADYLFFPSYNNYEMMPMVLLEAISSNLKVFAYDLDVCKALLPQNNVFQYKDFYQIKDALLNQQIEYSKIEYNDEYGKHKWIELLETIKHT